MTMAWSKPIFQCDLFPGYQELYRNNYILTKKTNQISGSILRCFLPREDAIINSLRGNSSYNYTEKSSNYIFGDIIGLKTMVIF